MNTYRTFRQLNELDAIRRADTLRQLPEALPQDDDAPTGAAVVWGLACAIVTVAVIVAVFA
jgi:hypothetical protein